MAKLNLDAEAAFENNAYTLAHLADAAYADAPMTDSSFQKTAFTEAATFSSALTNTHGFIAANAQNVVVAFRGTAQIQDWLTNLAVAMRWDAELGGNVHKGFAGALDSVWNQIQSLLNQLEDADQTIWVTGHSLGGALATLAAKRMAPPFKPFAIYTYGQPRVGDLAFSKAFKLLEFRFVNNRDIVPTVPPRFIPGAFPPAFYTHVGTLEFFDADGNLVLKTGEELGVFPELLDALGPLADQEMEAKRLIAHGLRDHKLANYIKCLKQALPDENGTS
jgi:predicted lipase